MSEGRKRWMSQLSREENVSSFAFLFFGGTSPQWIGWYLWIRWPSVFSLSIQILLSSRNPSQTLTEIILMPLWASLSSVNLTPSESSQGWRQSFTYLLNVTFRFFFWSFKKQIQLKCVRLLNRLETNNNYTSKHLPAMEDEAQLTTSTKFLSWNS